jgi:fatty-acyl-CoA synthase
MKMALNYETLIEPVVERARQNPQHPSIIFLNDDGTSTTITAEKFHADASGYARALQACGIGPEDLVILVLRHSQTLLSAFWGAMYRGAIASVFPFLTEKLDPVLYKQRVKTLVAQEGARAVITFPEFKDEMCELLKDVDCRVLSTDEVLLGQPGSEQFWAEPSGEKIAFLQHSSGTTGLQKGVALSHRAVLNQIRAYSRAMDLHADDVIVSWLPLYHDMGLIAGFIMPLVTGVPLVLMSPFTWVRSPKILLQAISQYRGTLCWLPNFAYNHSVRGIRERDLEGVDLSSLRAVINCSEPVRYDSHQMFYHRFEKYGLKEEALAACYAMAENTFAVTQSPIGSAASVDWVKTSLLQQEQRAEQAPEGSPGSTPMMSCGFPVDGVEIGVVDENRVRLPERRVGEIILRSDCMLSSYYRRPEATAQAMVDGWYYTGDIGYLAGGQLYISGRKKDMIIVGGKNIFPQDLEAIANTVPGLYPGRSVAFGLMDDRVGSEAIVMVCELEDENASEELQSEIERSLRLLITQQTEVVLSDVLLVGHGWLIKTSSGKIARGDNREKYKLARNITSES